MRHGACHCAHHAAGVRAGTDKERARADYWEIYESKPKNYKANLKVSKIVSLYFPELNEYRIGMVEIETFV